MPGVNIQIKGTGKGIVTGPDGSYSISVAKAEDILVFSFIGFKPLEFKVGTNTTINVTLEPQLIAMESVVVMGYSTKEEK